MSNDVKSKENEHLDCPSCNCDQVSDRGEIPATNQFAGRTVNEIIAGGHLYSCSRCNLQFRHPQPTREKLDFWYNQAADDHWANNLTVRNDIRYAKQLITKLYSKGRILDIGCFNGAFLSSLGSAYELFGIEINNAAAKLAKESGVEMVGQTYEDLANSTNQFDVITAIDVVEHVSDPVLLINIMIGKLRPGGIIILSTGNTDAWSWKLMGAKYGYCSVAEHISFINKRWCLYTAENLGMEVDNIYYFSHSQTAYYRKVVDLLKNALYLIAPRLVAKMRSFGKDRDDGIGKLVNPPPPWGSAKDHLLVQFSHSTTRKSDS